MTNQLDFGQRDNKIVTLEIIYKYKTEHNGTKQNCKTNINNFKVR